VSLLAKRKSKYILFAVLISFVLLLSACGELTIKLKSNGSGTAEIIFPNSEYLPPLDEFKREIEMNAAEEDGISDVKVKEKRDEVIMSVNFDNLSSLDSSAYEIPVSDLVILEDDILDDLELAKGTKEFTEKSKAILIKLPSDISDFTSAKTIVPGKIVAHSEGATVEKNNTISFDDASDPYFVYQPKSGIGSTIGIIAIIAIVGAGAFYILRKRKSNIDVKTDIPTKGD